MNILFTIKVKILELFKCYAYIDPTPTPSTILTILNLEWVTYFEHVLRSLLHTCLFGCMFMGPHLTTHHSNEGI